MVLQEVIWFPWTRCNCTSTIMGLLHMLILAGLASGESRRVLFAGDYLKSSAEKISMVYGKWKKLLLISSRCKRD